MKPGEYITSDLHFGHKLMAGQRGHLNITDHDEFLIKRWNAKVPARGAIVYILGDLSFHRNPRTLDILARLHGTFRLVRGNHDRTIKGVMLDPFEWVRDYYESKTDDGRKIVMSHYPMLTWNKAHYGSWMLHGHSHGNLRGPETTRLDVGVDCHGAPLSFADVSAIMELRTYTPVDHH